MPPTACLISPLGVWQSSQMCGVLHTDIMVYSAIPLGRLHLFLHRLLHSASFNLDQVSNLVILQSFLSLSASHPSGRKVLLALLQTVSRCWPVLANLLPSKSPSPSSGLLEASTVSQCTLLALLQRSHRIVVQVILSNQSANQSNQLSPVSDKRSKGFRCPSGSILVSNFLLYRSTLGSCWSAYPGPGTSNSTG